MKRLLPLVLLAACAHSHAPVATDADAARARAQWPGITVEELNHGRAVYVGHCGNCHLPPKPGDHPASEWPGHVAEMSERAGLDAQQQALVVRYLVTMASDTASAPAR